MIESNRFSKRAGGHSGPPLRGDYVFNTYNEDAIDVRIAQRGGMWSGWAASRTGQLLDTASQHTFGGWQGGHHRRWQYTSPPPEHVSPTIGDGRPTWPQGDTAKLSRTNRSTEFRVTSGDLGTHAMHLPRKRITDINKHRPSIFETRASAQRPGPTRRLSFQ